VRSKPGTVCVRTGTHTGLGPKIIYRYEQRIFNRVAVHKDYSGDNQRRVKVLLDDSAALAAQAASAQRGMSEFAALRCWLEAL